LQAGSRRRAEALRGLLKAKQRGPIVVALFQLPFGAACDPSGVACIRGGVSPCGLSGGAPPDPVLSGPAFPCGDGCPCAGGEPLACGALLVCACAAPWMIATAAAAAQIAAMLSRNRARRRLLSRGSPQRVAVDI
jgi:hypothetical protein